MVALLRSLGIPPAGVMTVNGQGYFGPAIPRRLCSRASERSRPSTCACGSMIAGCVATLRMTPQFRWLRGTSALSARSSSGMATTMRCCVWIPHIVGDLHPLADIDADGQNRCGRRCGFQCIGNYFIGFLRERVNRSQMRRTASSFRKVVGTERFSSWRIECCGISGMTSGRDSRPSFQFTFRGDVADGG